MKILFASDLHGSASAAEKVLERLEKEGADRFFLLGDLLYHGPVSYTHLNRIRYPGSPHCKR